MKPRLNASNLTAQTTMPSTFTNANANANAFMNALIKVHRPLLIDGLRNFRSIELAHHWTKVEIRIWRSVFYKAMRPGSPRQTEVFFVQGQVGVVEGVI